MTHTPWTPDENMRLREMFSRISNERIASVLGRTASSVSSQAHRLGLTKTHERLREAGREARRQEEKEDGR